MLDTFLAGLEAAFQLLLSGGSEVFSLYTGVPILAGILALWVLDRIFGIFKLIKG